MYPVCSECRDKVPYKVIPVICEMGDGYFYCPDNALEETPVTIDPDTFNPRKGMLARYSRKLLREGAKYYAKKPISDFIEPDK